MGVGPQAYVTMSIFGRAFTQSGIPGVQTHIRTLYSTRNCAAQNASAKSLENSRKYEIILITELHPNHHIEFKAASAPQMAGSGRSPKILCK